MLQLCRDYINSDDTIKSEWQLVSKRRIDEYCRALQFITVNSRVIVWGIYGTLALSAVGVFTLSYLVLC